jgi:hypothetical protein
MIKKKNNLLVLIFLLLTWISFWLSINTKPYEINFFNTNITSIINTLRISVPLLLTILTIPLIIFFILKRKVFLESKFIINPIFLFLIYFILQGIGLYFNKKLNFFDINNSYLIILSIGSLHVFFFLKIFNLNKNLNFFLYCSIFIITVAFLIFIYSMFKNRSSYELIYLYYYIDLDQKLFDQIFPRITGLARLMAVINLTILASFLFLKKNKSFKRIEFFFIVILSTLIWSSQSRGAILCFYTCALILIFFYKEYNFKKKLLTVIFIIIFPIFIFESYKVYKVNNFVKIISSNQSVNEREAVKEFYRLNENRIYRSKEQGSSGRINLWNEIIEKYDKKNIFGYGPQADRFLISKKLGQQYGNNVSNGFLYAFACGGYFALIIYVIINLKILTFIYKSIFYKKIFQIKNLFAEKLATIYLTFFEIRNLFENSYALFSIDFLLTLISFVIMKNYLEKKTI